MKRDFNWSVLDSILQFNATKPQCAAMLETSDDTIDRRIKKEYGLTFEQYKETKLGLTKIKLQQKAIQLAVGGNAVMLIFCLKNLCGWKDRFESEIDMKKLEVTIDLKDKDL